MKEIVPADVLELDKTAGPRSRRKLVTGAILSLRPVSNLELARENAVIIAIDTLTTKFAASVV